LAAQRGGYAIREWPAPERPRERMQTDGATALATRELLAILIGSGREGASAVDVAGELLRSHDGSLRRLAMASPTELENTTGVGPAVAARITAALELGRRLAREGPLERTAIKGPRDVFERCAPGMRDLPQEEFRVLLLNTQHAVMREITITRGTVDASIVHPREVFRSAIIENAAAMVLVHNHPSGDPAPSPPDKAITRQLAEVGRMIGIPVLDHIVIGDACYVSFIEAGLEV
jgi:DNA repair protein RadC